MFSSTIIPTVGRNSLSHSVCSVLDQSFSADGFEVIVVNDSGKPLPEMDWQSSSKVKVVNTQCRERGVARNTGAALAKGKYLHFLDDDDILLPGALQAFWELSQTTDAAWLHGHYQSMDNQGNVLQEFDPEMEGNIFANLIAGEAIPLQASLLNADCFFKAGAFDPNIPGNEDRDLSRRMALAGKTAGTTHVVARIRIGQQGSTTDWSRIAEMDRWSREKALREPGAYQKLAR
ncbi:MAG: glycosyltransferase family A protein, partial [Omnitrophica WOR_2 bacterium]